MPRHNHKHKPMKHTPFNFEKAGVSSSCQNKQAYASESAAKQAIMRTQQYNPDIELAIYYCQCCQKYHLTHKK
ncbi:MAG: hypothetical protein Q3996_01515 [Candidatus Saccharibacteria bacterium]|nr:hypothetical protein [Candidatus Saccharibacteria bacterium]